MADLYYLTPDEQKMAGQFLHGGLWPSFEKMLATRRPPAPEPNDPSHVAAAKGHQRAGFEACIEAMKTAPFETPQQPVNPFDIPAVAITED